MHYLDADGFTVVAATKVLSVEVAPVHSFQDGNLRVGSVSYADCFPHWPFMVPYKQLVTSLEITNDLAAKL